MGRWNIHECQIYMEVLKECREKDIIRELRRALPTRVESQIRAHHLKMMRKYKTIDRILEISDRPENKKMLRTNSRICSCLTKMTKILADFPTEEQQPPIKQEN